MDIGLIVAVVMLVVWGVGTFLEWGGWVHALLTIGVFLLYYRIIKRVPPRTQK